MYGAGPLNQFGKDFLRHGKNWTHGLCQLDSDNDGQKNGEELGDPWCEWTPGSADNLPLPRSHPGICDSPAIRQCTNGVVTHFVCPRQQNPPNHDPFNNLVFEPPPLPDQERNFGELDNIPNFQFLGRTLRHNQRPNRQPEVNPAPTPPPPTPPPPIPSVIHKRIRMPPVESVPPEQSNTDKSENESPAGLFSPFSLSNLPPNEPKSHDPPPTPKPPDVVSPRKPPQRKTSEPTSPFSLTNNPPIGQPDRSGSESNSNLNPTQRQDMPQSGVSSPFSLSGNLPDANPIQPSPNIQTINSNVNPVIIPQPNPNVNTPSQNRQGNTISSQPRMNSNSASNTQERGTVPSRPGQGTNTFPQNPVNIGNSRVVPRNNNNIPLMLRRGRFPLRNQNNLQLQTQNHNPFSRQPFTSQNLNPFSTFPGQTTSARNPLLTARQNPRTPFSRTTFPRQNPNTPQSQTGFSNTVPQFPFPMIPRNQSAVMRLPRRNTFPRQNPFQRFPARNQNFGTSSNTQQIQNSNQQRPVSNIANQRPRFTVQQVRANSQREPKREDPSLFVIRTLRQVMRPNFTCPGLTGPNIYTWMLRLPRVQIPRRFQSGVCMVFNLPTNGEFHLIGGTPMIDNRDAVQQMFVYGCDEGTTVPVTSRPYACDGMPRRECQNIIGGYAGSIPGICFPRSGGIRIGRTGFKQIILQVRWTNLFGRFGTTDSSGMTIYYTNILRQYDIGTKVLRATHFTIPPGQPAHTVSSTCPGECTVMQIRSPIYISMAFNHMHLLGRKEKVELVRNGEVVDLITEEDAFSYDDPKAYWHQTPIQVLPGDSLRMSCVYNSMNMQGNVSWGFGETDEICLATLFYYPKESWETTSCTSFRSIPLCKLETTGIVNDCDFNRFFGTLRRDFQTAAVLANCTVRRMCNDDCHSLAKAAQSHPCLKGDNFKLLESSVDISPDERLSVLFETLKICHSGIHGNEAAIPISNNHIPVNLLPDVQTVENMMHNEKMNSPFLPLNVQKPTLSPVVTAPPAPVISPLPTPLPPPQSTTKQVLRTEKKSGENEAVVRKTGDTRVKVIPINRNNEEESVQSTIIRLVQDHFRSVPISIVVISPDGLLRVENQVGLSSFTNP
ncbi:uncharacterized protein LOC132555864 [Ylistrum balloti]|uniref:uncharacterized protein LOC132555864 n=1 Tax=Ylistrum balloti TaxID=509963 RepID=UPI002905E560|nr:uncharacterized protein LOC132555864 [Ylistrum balloti]